MAKYHPISTARPATTLPESRKLDYPPKVRPAPDPVATTRSESLYKIGQKVTLASGSLDMTICDVITDPKIAPAHRYECRWHTKMGVPHKDIFHEDTLRMAR